LQRVSQPFTQAPLDKGSFLYNILEQTDTSVYNMITDLRVGISY